jgi:phospholipid/cholesterol/gamma-HCH transport system permease protein
MKITEQIDALKLLGISPVGYLVYPRYVASLIATTCLVLISIAITLGCAMAVAVIRYNFSVLEYISALKHFLVLKDLFCAITKGLVFGSIIPIVSASFGFRCAGGAQGVGEATTQAVVTSTSLVILFDFILTYLFTL